MSELRMKLVTAPAGARLQGLRDTRTAVTPTEPPQAQSGGIEASAIYERLNASVGLKLTNGMIDASDFYAKNRQQKHR